jgi:glycosyltransferase involved in cell wall biosynthesis
MAEKLKILQITNKPPYPPMDGGAIGMNNVAEEILAAGHLLKILSVNTHKHFIDPGTLPEDYTAKTGIEFCFLDTRIKPLDAFLNLFGRKSYNIQRFYSKEFEKKLVEILKDTDFDIVQVESVFLKDYLPAIRRHSKAKIVLRAPNVEYKIWERLAQTEKNPVKKFYLGVLAQRLKTEELSCLNDFDAIYTVTPGDMEIFEKHGAKVPMTFIPTGLDVTKQNVSDNHQEELSLFHIGALDWMPNQEGLQWFLDNVWPEISKRFPAVKFYIAGRRPPEWMLRLNRKNVVMLGEVDDAGSFIRSHQIMVVPLFSGSGMRVKIIEGMMLGKAVVSTTIGAEGIIVKNGEDIMIADSAKDFIDALALLLSDAGKLTEIKTKAAKNCYENYSEEVITKKLNAFFETIVR